MLTPRERAIVRAAVEPGLAAGAQLEALTRASGLSLARTFQELNALISDPRAWEAEPAALAVLARRRESGSRLRRGR